MQQLLEANADAVKEWLEQYGINTEEVVIRPGYDFKFELKVSSLSPLKQMNQVHEEFTIVRVIEDKKEEENE